MSGAPPPAGLTGLPLAEGDVGQQVVAGDDAQELQDVAEVGLVAAALPLQRQQEVPPAADAPALVLIDHIHEEEGQNADVSVGQVGADNGEHLVKRVQAVGAVRRLLRPRLTAAAAAGHGPLGPPPSRAARPLAQTLVVRWSRRAQAGVQLAGLDVRVELLGGGVLGRSGAGQLGQLGLLGGHLRATGDGDTRIPATPAAAICWVGTGLEHQALSCTDSPFIPELVPALLPRIRQEAR